MEENFVSHIHARNAFGEGIQSTSHVESLWAQIKSEIKGTYKMVPSSNLLYFIKEAEWKSIGSMPQRLRG